MSKITTVTISWSTSGAGKSEGSSETFTISNSADESILVPLTNGRTQVFLPGPPTLTAALIVPPTNSTVAKTYDASGAIGGALNPALPTLITLPSGTTSFYIGANGSETVQVYAW